MASSSWPTAALDSASSHAASHCSAGAGVSDLTSAFDIRTPIARQDLLYRGGSSLRAASGQDCASLCQGGDLPACTSCAGEPMWLAANPP